MYKNNNKTNRKNFVVRTISSAAFLGKAFILGVGMTCVMPVIMVLSLVSGKRQLSFLNYTKTKHHLGKIN